MSQLDPDRLRDLWQQIDRQEMSAEAFQAEQEREFTPIQTNFVVENRFSDLNFTLKRVMIRVARNLSRARYS
jgi:hypothetical protein